MKYKSSLACALLVTLILLFAGCTRPTVTDLTIARLFAVLSTKDSLPQVTDLKRNNGNKITANLHINGGEFAITIYPELFSDTMRLVLVRTENGVRREIEMYFSRELLNCTGGGEDWSKLTARRKDSLGVKQRWLNRRDQWLEDIKGWLDIHYPQTKVPSSPEPTTPPSVD